MELKLVIYNARKYIVKPEYLLSFLKSHPLQEGDEPEIVDIKLDDYCEV